MCLQLWPRFALTVSNSPDFQKVIVTASMVLYVKDGKVEHDLLSNRYLNFPGTFPAMAIVTWPSR